MKYSWCVCDLDGTLLDDKNNISPDNKKALSKLVSSGTKLIIATGRSDLMIKKYLAELDIKTPVIACNGGLIRNHSNGEVVYYKDINKSLAYELTNYCKDKNFEFLMYTINNIYYSKDNKRKLIFDEFNKTVSEQFRVPMHSFDEFDWNDSSDPIIKVLISGADSTIMMEIEKNFNTDKKLTLVSSGKGLIDIMSSNITKGEALKRLSNILDIDLSKTIGFGDNFNDVSFLSLCGFPIAVKNAEDDVKKIAKLVTLSNDESGVAHAIDNFILIDS